LIDCVCVLLRLTRSKRNDRRLLYTIELPKERERERERERKEEEKKNREKEREANQDGPAIKVRYNNEFSKDEDE
jgi:hypothetical protein